MDYYQSSTVSKKKKMTFYFLKLFVSTEQRVNDIWRKFQVVSSNIISELLLFIENIA